MRLAVRPLVFFYEACLQGGPAYRQLPVLRFNTLPGRITFFFAACLSFVSANFGAVCDIYLSLHVQPRRALSFYEATGLNLVPVFALRVATVWFRFLAHTGQLA